MYAKQIANPVFNITLYKDFEIIEGLKKGDQKAINHIYRSSRGSISRMVKSHGGDEEDVCDIIQEALIVLISDIKRPEFILICSFSTYFYAVCRNLWRNEMRRIGKGVFSSVDCDELIDEEDTAYYITQKHLFEKHWNNLSCENKELLSLFFQKVSYKTITKIMGYGKESYARRKKYNGKRTLQENIRKDPAFKLLIEK